jgi:hypothetical protein
MATQPVAGRDGSPGALDASTVRRWVERTCAAQSLPVRINDPSAIAQLATLFGVQACAQAAA